MYRHAVCAWVWETAGTFSVVEGAWSPYMEEISFANSMEMENKTPEANIKFVENCMVLKKLCRGLGPVNVPCCRR